MSEENIVIAEQNKLRFLGFVWHTWAIRAYAAVFFGGIRAYSVIPSDWCFCPRKLPVGSH